MPRTKITIKKLDALSNASLEYLEGFSSSMDSIVLLNEKTRTHQLEIQELTAKVTSSPTNNDEVLALSSRVDTMTAQISTMQLQLSSYSYDTTITARSAIVSCLMAYPLLSDTFWQPKDMNNLSVITRDGYNGVLVNGGIGTSFDLVLPYMVVIGDSIAEGHPASHGRLHVNGTAGYDATAVSSPGQLSYELARKYNIPTINQGIGGQTTTEVRARWNRDALAMVSDPRDGRGDVTLEFGGQKPSTIYVHCGINDVFSGVSADIIKTNMAFFAQSCMDNNIQLLLANIGADSAYDSAKQAVAEEVNNWLLGEFSSIYTNAVVVDYLDWSSDGTGAYTTLKAGMFSDTVHPTTAGYIDYTNYIYTHVDSTPLALTSITLGSELGADSPSRFQRITGFTIGAGAYTLSTGSITEVPLQVLPHFDSPVQTLEVTHVTEITGDGYTGFAASSAKITAITPVTKQPK